MSDKPQPYKTVTVEFPTKEEYEDACQWADAPVPTLLRLRKGVVPIKDAIKASQPVRPQAGRFYELTDPHRSRIPAYYRRVEVLHLATDGDNKEVLCVRDGDGDIYTIFTDDHTFKEVQ